MLVHGELTGHSYRVADPASLFASGVCFSLDICGDQALVVHDEHGTITPARGVCQVWRQRKFTPQRIVAVQD
ncbi:hypothetical protein [Methylobacterium sp. SyP6R]|uniref:hypothetical protein n=1 Tax=Methylobacterium sp. SyP6R TaxID=2718876 RepID=UPI001F2FF3E7|nr:hypothetical protein [Methylobacterium sp. SyP6R]MCF4129591.1 hypothetical protein [Methylobacterium sp. SyP6R]